MQEITSSDAIRLIRSARGKYFTVGFSKRKDNSFRTMTGRLGVRKGTTGDGKSFSDADHDLVTVSETVRERDSLGRIRTLGTQFRAFGIERLRSLAFKGETFSIVYDGIPLKKIR
jgi:hypothetical protein